MYPTPLTCIQRSFQEYVSSRGETPGLCDLSRGVGEGESWRVGGLESWRIGMVWQFSQTLAAFTEPNLSTFLSSLGILEGLLSWNAGIEKSAINSFMLARSVLMILYHCLLTYSLLYLLARHVKIAGLAVID